MPGKAAEAVAPKMAMEGSPKAVATPAASRGLP